MKFPRSGGRFPTAALGPNPQRRAYVVPRSDLPAVLRLTARVQSAQASRCAGDHPLGYLASSNKERAIFGPCLTRVLLTAISCCGRTWHSPLRENSLLTAANSSLDPLSHDQRQTRVNQSRLSCKVGYYRTFLRTALARPARHRCAVLHRSA